MGHKHSERHTHRERRSLRSYFAFPACTDPHADTRCFFMSTAAHSHARTRSNAPHHSVFVCLVLICHLPPGQQLGVNVHFRHVVDHLLSACVHAMGRALREHASAPHASARVCKEARNPRPSCHKDGSAPGTASARPSWLPAATPLARDRHADSGQAPPGDSIGAYHAHALPVLVFEHVLEHRGLARAQEAAHKRQRDLRTGRRRVSGPGRREPAHAVRARDARQHRYQRAAAANARRILVDGDLREGWWHGQRQGGEIRAGGCGD